MIVLALFLMRPPRSWAPAAAGPVRIDKLNIVCSIVTTFTRQGTESRSRSIDFSFQIVGWFIEEKNPRGFSGAGPGSA